MNDYLFKKLYQVGGTALWNVTIPSMVEVDGAAEFQLTLLLKVMTHNVNFIEPRYM